MLNSLRNAHSRTVLTVAVFVALAATMVIHLARPVINPDAMLYLRAAEQFVSGDWAQGLSTYRWPFYSVTIAGIMKATGFAVEPAAIVVNGALDALLIVAFAAMVRQLDPERPFLLVAAALLIVLHPRLIQFRPSVIRDHGYHAFFFSSLYFVLRDQATPRLAYKAAAFACVLLAAAFRPEAVLLLAVVPAWHVYRLRESRAWRGGVIAAMLLLCLVGMSIYVTWYTTLLPSPAAFAAAFAGPRQAMAAFASYLPEGRNTGLFAYIGYILVALVDVLLRAVTIPIAVLSALAFVPQRLMPNEAARFAAWFAAWQVPALLIVAIFSLVFDWRYATAFGLLASIPAAFAIATALEEFAVRMRRSRIVLPVVLAALIVPWIAAAPRFADMRYLEEAGRWIGQALPRDATYVTNDGRLAYYAGLPYERVIRDPDLQRIPVAYRDIDYALVDVVRADAPVFVARRPGAVLIRTFEGPGGRRVAIYKLR